MDDYPAFSLDHNSPLLVALGIQPGPGHEDHQLDRSLRDGSVILRSEAPSLDSEQAQALLSYIRGRDASKLPWNGREAAGRKYSFRVRAAARPVADLPPTPPPSDPSPGSGAGWRGACLALSLLAAEPRVPLYPDGVIDARWLQKHQELVPSVLLCFYSLTSDQAQAAPHDNKIKADINSLKSTLGRAAYRTRFAVVLLGDRIAPSAAEGLQERLEGIRRGCGVDPKSFFLVPPHMAPEELERIAENMLTTLYAHAIDYYWDLTRHARKKKTRGVVPEPTLPPTSGTSQTLSLPGWNVRYDFKTAVFAECRQEMDSALRSYEQAYENLLGSELLEIIPSWSPRWNEARLLADVISIRCLRCHLWDGKSTGAVRRWQYHRDRISDLVDRRGRGTRNYGWQAWEARWALVMADLLDKAGMQSSRARAASTPYLPPEKMVSAERLQPWDLLHHSGYWFRLSARHLHGRRAYAHSIPEDDRKPPSASPASRVAKKAFTYDTYMCPDPHEEYPLDGGGVDHSQLIVDRLMSARSEFMERKQARSCAEISLECARELSSSERWLDVVELLEPLWRDMPFRTEGWLLVAEDLSWCLRTSALHAGRADLVVAIDWELMNRSFSRRPKWHYDMGRSLQGLSPEAGLVIRTDDNTILPFVTATFASRHEEGRAGETAPVQLSLASNAHRESVPVILSKLEVDFVGSVKRLVLQHDGAAAQQTHGDMALSSVAIRESAEGTEIGPGSDDAASHLTGAADLSLLPGRTLVLSMDIPLREPGEASARSVIMSLSNEDYRLEHTATLGASRAAGIWWSGASGRKRLARADVRSIRVLPRPPKVQIRQVAIKDEYYTNETIGLRFELVNAEDEDASAKLDVALLGGDAPAFSLKIGDRESEESAHGANEEPSVLASPVGTISSSGTVSCDVRTGPLARSARYELNVRVAYHLAGDRATSIIQTATFPLNIANPFEANYDLLPRLHLEPWPSFFDYVGIQDSGGEDDTAIAPNGLIQAWCLVTRYASFASDRLRVVDLEVRIRSSPDVHCFNVKKSGVPEGGRQVSPKTIEEATFDLVAQKTSQDERSPASLDVSFMIKWTRPDADPSESPNVTVLPVPKLAIFGTEPRVLASVSYAKGLDSLVILDIVIENASNHFLTFGLTMEPSDEFAFSGAKQTTLHLLPVSRRSVTYRLLPLVRGEWIKPGLVVRDKYFQKVLRVIPTEGMRAEKDGFSLWVPPDLEEAED